MIKSYESRKLNIPGILKHEPALLDLYAHRFDHELSALAFKNKKGDHKRALDITYASRKKFCSHEYAREMPVSRYLDLHGIKCCYPDNKKFAVCLTHDIDDISQPLSHIINSSLYTLKKSGFKGAKELIPGNSSKPGQYKNFKKIMEIEKKYGAVSSFYFLATDKDPLRFRYDIEEILEDLESIRDSGFEIGLHGGYYAYCDPVMIKKEKDRLEKACRANVIGYRNHYLMFKFPDTWRYLASCGFKYDSSMGFNDISGSRNGMCHPYRPYDPIKGEEIDIFEIPLMIMDSSLLSHEGDIKKAWETSKIIIDTVESLNGVLTLCWHNNVFSYAPKEQWARLYEKILSYCHEKNAWMTSGREIYSWFT
jgi:peptidoglycan/xylan/chitin deacetylase (PgdA/CDA1 family)